MDGSAVEGFIDFFSKERRVGAENAKSGIKKNASPFVGTSSGSKRKVNWVRGAEDKWVCCQNGSLSSSAPAGECSRWEKPEHRRSRRFHRSQRPSLTAGAA